METVRLNSECIECLMQKYLPYFSENAREEQKVEYMQAILKVIAEAPLSASAPELVDEISKIQKSVFGFSEDFDEVKKYFNALMMEFEDEIQKEIDLAEDPLKLAVCYAMTGNYIDFGAMKNVDIEKLRELLAVSGSIDVDENELSHLKSDLETANKLVFLTDNCGEIVLDKLLLSTIKSLYPNIEINVIVRGEPVLNDATMEDAVQIGLPDLFMVSPNGSSIAGTCLHKISDDAKNRIDNADIIIAKGQGNFETLRYCERNVYYIFMCKCEMFAKRFCVPRFSGMLLNDFRLK